MAKLCSVICLLLVFFAHQNLEAQSGEDDDDVVTERPLRHKKPKHEVCKIQINELGLGGPEEEQPMQFIELRRFCPENSRIPVKSNLDGHVLMAVQLGEVARVLMIVNLMKNSHLREVRETKDNREIISHLHLTGTQNLVDRSITFGIRLLMRNRQVQYFSHPELYKILPQPSETPVVLFLLYFKTTERFGPPYSQIHMDFYTDNNDQITYIDVPITSSQTQCIKNRVVDYLVYGSKATDSANIFLKDVLDDDTFDLTTKIIGTASCDSGSVRSFSRCSDKSLEPSSFLLSEPTPFLSNSCPKYVPPYKFHGHSITRDGQKISLNVIHFLRQHPFSIKGQTNFGTMHLASKMLGLSSTTLTVIEQRHASGNVVTPGRKRRGKKWKQAQIDNFDRDVLRSIIAGFYKDNLAPYFADIFKAFMEYKRSKCVPYTTSSLSSAPSRWLPLCLDETEAPTSEVENSPGCSQASSLLQCNPATPTSAPSPQSEFKISAVTFAHVLRELGFYYGRVNKRVALLYRQDILAWRGRYLLALRRNAAKSTPLKVTYLDETWIDPNLKSTKGWTLKKPKSFKECQQYSYRRMKQGHGPRIIALAAGDEDGIIPESVLVYKVQKNAHVLDYHENVNKEGFINWLKNLMEHWRTKQEKHLIVMDNAPYHSSLRTPRQSEKKAVLYEWLEKIKNNADYNINFELNSRQLKWELWALIQDLKKRPELQREVYEIDDLVAREGHEILRLNPYGCDLNPIELTWNDVKQQVARENVRQNVDETVQRTRDTLIGYSKIKWKKQIEYVKRLEQKYYEEDGLMDIEVEPLIIPLDNEDEEDEVDVHSCDDHEDEGCRYGGDDFDPEALEKQWEQDRADVARFHVETPFYPGPPPVQPTRLFPDEEDE